VTFAEQSEEIGQATGHAEGIRCEGDRPRYAMPVWPRRA
jgi:hypothetical protein